MDDVVPTGELLSTGMLASVTPCCNLPFWDSVIIHPCYFSDGSECMICDEVLDCRDAHEFGSHFFVQNMMFPYVDHWDLKDATDAHMMEGIWSFSWFLSVSDQDLHP